MEQPIRDERLLQELERSLLDPDVRRSPEKVSALLAAGFVEFGRSGRVYERQLIIEGLQQEAPVRRSMTDFSVRWLADTVALITYRSSRRDEENGKTLCSLRSSVWSHIDGRWQMVFHQGTPTSP